MQARQLIGLDLGEKRTGIARASTVARLAEPLATVPTDELIPTLKKMVADQDIEKIVLGLPRNLNGDDTAQTKWVRHWLQTAKKLLPDVDFVLQDEALTTSMATVRAGKNVTEVDAEAATIILQDFMDGEI